MEQSFLDREPTGRLFLGEWFEEDSKGIDLPVEDRIRLPLLDPVDFSKLSPSMFSEDEITRIVAGMDIIVYLQYLHYLANSVIEVGAVKPGPHPFAGASGSRNDVFLPRGWISATNQVTGDGIDRNGASFGIARHMPSNARVMENFLGLVYFCCTNRPWNPYYRNPALARRIEAAFRYWFSLFRPDGGLPGKVSWSPRGASNVFGMLQGVSAVYYMIKDRGGIRDVIFNRVYSRCRNCLLFMMNSAVEYTAGNNSANQYNTLFTSVALWLSEINPADTEMRDAFDQRFPQCYEDYISDAGFFYEERGPDWSYDIAVSHPVQSTLFKHIDPKNKPFLLTAFSKWFEWISYNFLPEPDFSTFRLFAAISSRTSSTSFSRFETSMGSDIPLALAYTSTSQRIESLKLQRIEEFYINFPATIPQITGYHSGHFGLGSQLSPVKTKWNFPTAEEQAQARTLLPCFKPNSFNHQRRDSKFFIQEFSYIKRPSYYAAFASGQRTVHLNPTRQRMGLGLIWNASTGVIWQSQNNSNVLAWGTLLGSTLVEANNMVATYSINGSPYTPENGAFDIPYGDLKIEYTISGVSKIIEFKENSIDVEVTYDGSFEEQFPFLNSSANNVVIEGNSITISRNGGSFLMTFDGATNFIKANPSSGIVRTRVAATNSLKYTISYIP